MSHILLLVIMLFLSYSVGVSPSCAQAPQDEPVVGSSQQVLEHPLTPQEIELRNEMDAQRAVEDAELQVDRTLRTMEMINLAGGLIMGKYEVTQAQWQAVMHENPARFAMCGESCPIENVSWNEVQAFLIALNAKTGKHYRLPTEQEWLNACRAGGAFEYCGSHELDSIAWYAENAHDTPHAVGLKKPNAWGLYDMSGNVSEWTKTCEDNECLRRIICGGSWLNSKDNLNLSARDWLKAGLRNSRLGFRLVLDR